MDLKTQMKEKIKDFLNCAGLFGVGHTFLASVWFHRAKCSHRMHTDEKDETLEEHLYCRELLWHEPIQTLSAQDETECFISDTGGHVFQHKHHEGVNYHVYVFIVICLLRETVSF